MWERKLRFGIGMCVHNEEDYIAYSLHAVYNFADVIALSVNTGVPWGGKSEPLDKTLELIRAFPDPDDKIRIITGEWHSEIEQRNSNLNFIRDIIDYYMIVDADEIYRIDDLARLQKYISMRPFVGQFRVRLNTYWKTNPFYIIDPPEPLKAYVISRVRRNTRFIGLRRTNEVWRIVVPRKVAICHHFSYARSSEKILQKLSNFSHKNELVSEWFENVWKRWDNNHNIENLHPTHPAEYQRAIPVDINSLPEVMRDHPFVWDKGTNGNICRNCRLSP